MEHTPPSLGDQIARLRTATQAQERCAWIPSAIHALIAALFARIFDRLESLILLWQSGTLPPAPRARCDAPSPQAPHTRAPYTRAARPASSRSSPASPPAGPNCARHAGQPASHGPNAPAKSPTRDTAPARLCPHSARAPPGELAEKPPEPRRHRLPIILRYRNK